MRDRITEPLREYADEPWVDYLGVETVIELSTTIEDYEIHEIVSVNVYQTDAANALSD